MSQLERLAEAIVQVGKQSGPAQQSIARTQQAASRLAPMVPNDEAGYARTIRTHLYAAAEALRDVERLLTDFDKQADAFAKRLVGASAGLTYGGGSGEPPAASPKPATPDEIRSWIGKINPGHSDSLFDPRSVNCGKCAHAVFDALNGEPVRDAGRGTLTQQEMADAIGRGQIHMTPSTIADRLRAEGAGAHAVVGIDREKGGGHWFNAYFDGKDVWAIDGQTGTVSGWPPEYGSPHNPVTYWDVSE